MKISQKRILILFSLMLNIGFVIVAVAIMTGYPGLFHKQYSKEITDLVAELKLPEAQEEAALASVAQYQNEIKSQEHALQEARDAVIRLLAIAGPMDRDALHRCMEAVNHQEELRNAGFEAHVTELRHMLGDDKGAQFFSLLHKHIKETDHRKPR